MTEALPTPRNETADAAVASPARAVWIGLAILTLINLFNYLDRFVLPAVMESIKHSELRPSDTELGWLSSGFIIVYMLSAPIIGALGDQRSRPRLIALGVAMWSVATALGGIARSYVALLGARALVGIGEAAYGTIAPALLADYFPARLRGRVFAIFFMATPVGSALGYVLGGAVDQLYGWRHAFFIAGLPGLLLAALALGLREPKRGRQDVPSGDANIGRPAMHGFRSYVVLARNRPYRLTVLGYAAYTFALGGIAVWMPVFLQRVRGFPPRDATVGLGAVLVVTGFVGTFAGGWVGDLLLRRTTQAYLWVSGIATLAAAPLAYLALVSSDRMVYWISLTAAEVLIFASTGPINSAIVNVVHPTMRAAAMAASIFTIHILGDVPSPTLIGEISDLSSLAQAVLVIPVAVTVGGVIWIYAAYRGSISAHPH